MSLVDTTTGEIVTDLTAAPRDSDRIRIRESRVALRAMTSQDFHRFAVEERRRAGQDFSARNDACSCAEWVAEQMARAGARRFDMWALGVDPA